MRILKLEFENINSLKGHYVIDFTKDDFMHSSIFAITGPTGAGKSSILDAISLALFQQTDRTGKVTTSSNEVMSRGTTSCAASLYFEVKNTSYLAKFKQKIARSRKENTQRKYQDKEVHLYKIDFNNNTIIESIAEKANDFNNAITEITGLNFERFTRAVMLCQGKFASFLRADKSLKISILENLSDTKEYSKISKAIYEANINEKNRLDTVYENIKNITLLNDEQIDSLNNEIKELQDLKEKNSHIHDKCVEDNLTYTNRESEQNSLNQYLTQDTEIDNEILNFRDSILTINKALEAKDLNTDLNTALIYKNIINKNKDSILQNNDNLLKYEGQKDSLSLNVKNAEANLNQYKKEYDLKIQSITKARLLDTTIQKDKQSLEEDEKGLEALKIDLAKAKERLDKTSAKKDTVEKEKNLLQNISSLLSFDSDKMHEYKLSCISIDKDLASAYTEQEKCLKELEDLESKKQNLETDLTKLTEEKTKYNNELTSLDNALQDKESVSKDYINLNIEDLNAKSNSLNADITSLSSKHDEITNHVDNIHKLFNDLDKFKATFEQTQEQIDKCNDKANLIATKRDLINNLLKRKNDRDLILSFEEQRKRLHHNEPCPLCGSLEHPYCQNLDLSLFKDDLEDEIKKNEEKITSLTNTLDNLKQNLSTDIINLVSLKEKIKSNKDNIDKYFINNLLKIKIENEDAESQIQELSNKIKDYLDLNYQSFATLYCELDLDNLNTDVIDFTLNLDEILNTIDTDFNTLDNLINSTLSNVKAKLNTLDSNIKLYNEYISFKDENRKKFNDLQNELKSLDKPYEEQNNTLITILGQIKAHNDNFKKYTDLIKDKLVESVDIILSKESYSLFKEQSVENCFVLDALFTEANLEDKRVLDLKNSYVEIKNKVDLKLKDTDKLNSLLNKDVIKIQDFILDLKGYVLSYFKLITEFKEKIQVSLEKARESLVTLNDDVSKATNDLNTLSTKDEMLTNKISELKTSIQNNEENRFKTIETQNLDELQKIIDTKKEELEAVCEQERAKQNDNNNLITIAHNNINEAQQTIEENIPLYETSNKLFEDKFYQSSFNSIEEINKSLLKDNELLPLIEKRDSLYDKSKELKNKIQDTKKRIDAFTNKLAPDFDKEKNNDLIASLKERDNSLTQDISNKQNIIKQNKLLDEEQKSKKEAYDRDYEKYKILSTLNDLIGSASGEKFSAYVQRLTLSYIVKIANTELAKLSQRYILDLRDDNTLSFDVIDKYRGNIRRVSENLSGGETFLVSLSLALALSKMASNKIRIDSLFLDEGFGTLDDDTLSVALGAINNMQQEGKLIGIISHISTLKENIKTQIEIRPKGDGTSSVFLNNQSLEIKDNKKIEPKKK